MHKLPSCQSEESLISRDSTEVAQAVFVFQCCMYLAARLQYWALCSGTNVNLCSAGTECEGERSGCPRIPARWKPIHSERHSGYRGRSQARWGQACGREEWWRESFLCLKRSAYVVKWEPAVNLAAHFKTLWSRRAHCILIRCVLIRIRDSWDLSDTVPWIFTFFYSWLTDIRFCSPTFCLKSGFSLVRFVLKALRLIIVDVDHIWVNSVNLAAKCLHNHF